MERHDSAGGGSGSLVEAVEVLVEPPPYEAENSDLMASVKDAWGQIVSGVDVEAGVAGLIGEALDELVGGSTADKVTEMVMGKWYEMPRAAQAWRAIADSQEILLDDLLYTSSRLTESWEGRAAGYYTSQVGSWIAALETNARMSRWYADELERSADYFQARFETFSTAVEELLDALLEAAVVGGKAFVTRGRSGSVSEAADKIVDCITRVKDAISSFFEIVDSVKNVAALVTSGELSSFEPSWDVLRIQ
jgi:uncharacterized protein YukE